MLFRSPASRPGFLAAAVIAAAKFASRRFDQSDDLLKLAIAKRPRLEISLGLHEQASAQVGAAEDLRERPIGDPVIGANAEEGGPIVPLLIDRSDAADQEPRLIDAERLCRLTVVPLEEPMENAVAGTRMLDDIFGMEFAVVLADPVERLADLLSVASAETTVDEGVPSH